MRGHTQTLVGFGLSALILALLARTVDPAAIGSALATADYRLIPLAVGLYFSGVFVRSARWHLLLPPGSGSTWLLFRALVVGFTVNNLLPGRLGEFARAYLLSVWRGVPYGVTLASVVVERILDGLALAFILLLALALVPDAPGYLLVAGLGAFGGFSVGALLVALAAWRSDVLIRLADAVARRLPPRLARITRSVARSFASGLGIVRGLPLLLRLAALSLLGWLFELTMFWVVMQALPMPSSWGHALLSGAAANFATLAPSSPGYVGTFDGVLSQVLVDSMDVSRDLATAYAIVVHATLYFPVILVGMAVLWRANIGFAQVTRLRRPRPEIPATAETQAP